MASTFKGLTQKQIDKRIKEGRGQGTGKDYKPFIYVHEVSSKGRVHRILGYKTKRIHHLLSDLELAIFLTLDWSANVIDIREQFPLAVDETISIAREAGISHSKYNGVTQVLSSDFLVKTNDIESPLFAIQAKYSDALDSPVTIERLELERRYWRNKDYPWYICTELEISKVNLDNIKWLYPAQQEPLHNNDLQRYFELYCKIFESSPNINIVSASQDVDLSYDLENGTALYWLRNLLARRFFIFDLSIPYRKLNASQLLQNAHQEQEVVYASA